MSVLFGRYEIQKKIGQGSSGTVYLCRDLKLGKLQVAVKVLPQWLLDRPVMRARLASEVLSLHSINSPHVVSFYDLHCDNETTAIVMEFIPGQSLRARIDSGDILTTEQKFRIAGQLLRGLADIHNLGLIHRDLKPENLIVNEQGNLKIVDLGLVTPRKVPGEGHALIESSHSTGAVGTPLYLAPEYIRLGIISERADVFAATMIIFELFLGAQLFSREDEGGLLEDKSYGNFSRLLSGLSVEFQKFIQYGGDPIPARRYPNGGVMLDAFSKLEKDAGVANEYQKRSVGEPRSSSITSSYASQALYVGAKTLEFSYQSLLRRVFLTPRSKSARVIKGGAIAASLCLIAAGIFILSQELMTPVMQVEASPEISDYFVALR